MSNPKRDDLDFSQVPDDAVNEFYRQAELCLQGTVQLAIAADSRATTLTGTLGAATAALLVLAANLDGKDKVDGPLLTSVLTAAAFLLIGSALCARAARPVDFHIPGYQPKALYDAASSERHIKLEAASDIQIRIEENAAHLKNAAKVLLRGRLAALFALPAAATSFFLSAHWGFFLHLSMLGVMVIGDSLLHSVARLHNSWIRLGFLVLARRWSFRLFLVYHHTPPRMRAAFQ